MAAPTFVAVGTHNGSAGAYTNDYPAGMQEGDFLWLIVETYPGQNTATPSGWTAHPFNQVNSNSGAEATQLNAFYRFVPQGGLAGTVSISDAGDHQSSQIAAFRGVSQVTPFNTQVSGTGPTGIGSTTFTGSGLTTTRDECLCVFSVADGRDAASARWTSQANTSLTGIAEIMDNGISSGNGGGIGCWYGTKATAGSVAVWTANFTGGGSNIEKAWIHMALRPPGVFDFAADLATQKGKAIDLGFQTNPYAWFDIEDMPADFGTAKSATLQIRWKHVQNPSHHGMRLYAQLFRADKVTPLSNRMTVADVNTETGAFDQHAFSSAFDIGDEWVDTNMLFTGVDTSAAKSVWDNALMKLVWERYDNSEFTLEFGLGFRA